MAQRIMGLDIGRSAIKGVVLETSLRTFALVGYHSEPIGVEPTADDEQRHAAIQAALYHLKERLGPVDQVITALSGDIGATSVLELPFSDPTNIDRILEHQLEELTPFDVDDLIFDYQFIERSKGPSRLLVASAPKSQIKEFLDNLQEVQIDPRTVTVDGLPFFHLFGNTTEMPHAPVWGVLDMGYHQTTLTIFRARPDEPQAPFRIESVRTLSRGTRHIRQGLAQAMGIDVDQADDLMLRYLNLDPSGPTPNQQVTDAVIAAMNPMVMELRRTVTASLRKLHIPIEQLYMTGGGALLQGISEFLGQRLNLHVHRLTATQLPTLEGVEWPDAPDTYLKALGLALHSMASRNVFARLNLRRQEFAFRGDLQFLKDRLGSLMLMAAILLLLFGASVFTSFYVRSVEGDRLEQEIQKRCSEIVGRSGLSPTKCLGIMNDEILKVSGKGSTALLPRTSAYDLLLVIYKRVSELTKDGRIKVEISSIRITTKRFDFEGETNSYGAVDQIEQRLRGYRCFRNIKKGKVQRSVGKTDKIEFRLSAVLSC